MPFFPLSWPIFRFYTVISGYVNIAIFTHKIENFESRSCFYDLLWLSKQFTSHFEQFWDFLKKYFFVSSWCHHVIIVSSRAQKWSKNILITFCYHTISFQLFKYYKSRNFALSRFCHVFVTCWQFVGNFGDSSTRFNYRACETIIGLCACILCVVSYKL